LLKRAHYTAKPRICTNRRPRRRSGVQHNAKICPAASRYDPQCAASALQSKSLGRAEGDVPENRRQIQNPVLKGLYNSQPSSTTEAWGTEWMSQHMGRHGNCAAPTGRNVLLAALYLGRRLTACPRLLNCPALSAQISCPRRLAGNAGILARPMLVRQARGTEGELCSSPRSTALPLFD